MSAMGIQINLDRVSTLPDAPKILVIKNKSEQSIDPEKSYEPILIKSLLV